MVILSVAAIAVSGAGASATGQLTLQESGHFNLAKSGHYNLASTTNVIAISRCRSGSYLEMSGFDVEFDSVFNGLNLT
jgi:hypothetical protein